MAYLVKNEATGGLVPAEDGTAREYPTREAAGHAAEMLAKALGGQWVAIDEEEEYPSEGDWLNRWG